MRPRTLLLLASVSAGLIGYAAYAALGAEGASDAVVEDLVVHRTPAEKASSVRADRTTARFIRPLMKRRSNLGSEYDAREHEQPVAPPPPTVGEISADDALVGFNGALDAMDEALEAGRTGRKRKRELYSQATMAFTALSVHLDGRDPEQRAVLEEAYFEMKQRMKALKMKVPKRPGVALHPPGG